MLPNRNYLNLKENYLFSEVARRVTDFTREHPEKEILRMGIGDVTRPLAPAIVRAMRKAVSEMGKAETFHGYGPEQGYSFLRTRLQSYYKENGITLDTEEIFVSDGAKSDLGNILDILSRDNTVLIPDPVYPVYADTNIMDGRTLLFADANESNGFLPIPDQYTEGDIIYLCSPNNPTGAVYDREQLKQWVEYALRNHALILFDAAYEAFITESGLPRSIYEIEGAKSCAIEFCSLSKTAGFTGVRCGYAIIPRELCFDAVSLNKLWLRRQSTKFNGVSYIVQKGAEAVFTPEGRTQIRENLHYYRENARIVTEALDELNIFYTGGKNSPYIWLQCPGTMDSWEFFDYLLQGTGIVGTPGTGFGKNGERFFRLTAFSTRENTIKAMSKLKVILRK